MQESSALAGMSLMSMRAADRKAGMVFFSLVRIRVEHARDRR
jgi:hypothetical protein